MHSHEVSASSSFLRFILSFRPSASRRAAAIFACICSPDISDIVKSDYPDEGDVSAVCGHNDGDWWMGAEGRVGGLKGHQQVHSPNGLRPQGKLKLEGMFDNGSVSESAGSVSVNAVAECSFRVTGALG